MPSKERPQRELSLAEEEFFLVEGWWRVKTATPAVTRKTTRYL